MKILPKSFREQGLWEGLEMGTALGNLGSTGTLPRIDDKSIPQRSTP